MVLQFQKIREEGNGRNEKEQSMSVGMPKSLQLHEFGSIIWDVFGDAPYHVGSSLINKTYRDVDVRLILDDGEYEKMNLGDPRYPHNNPKWRGLIRAFTLLGNEITGLPIDFQIQSRTHANKLFKGKRSFLGDVPHRNTKE